MFSIAGNETLEERFADKEAGSIIMIMMMSGEKKRFIKVSDTEVSRGEKTYKISFKKEKKKDKKKSDKEKKKTSKGKKSINKEKDKKKKNKKSKSEKKNKKKKWEKEGILTVTPDSGSNIGLFFVFWTRFQENNFDFFLFQYINNNAILQTTPRRVKKWLIFSK